MVDESPFRYQGPLPAEDVKGRDALIGDLVGRVTERRVTALVGPRRFGKTSVLRKLAATLTEVTTIWVDLYEVTSMADLAIRFDQALAQAPGPLAREAHRISAALRLNLGMAQVELSRPPKDRPDPGARFGMLVDTLVEAALRLPVLLVMDEFSSIDRVDGAAGRLRTTLQHHYTEMGIVFAGSMPSIMRQLFSDRPQPFYGQADLLEIGPLQAPAVDDIVRDGFGATGREAGPLPGLIFSFTEGHPQRTMQLADACWRATPAREAATAAAWDAGLAHVRASSAEGLERLFSHFQRREKDVLRIVASGGSVFGHAAGLLDLPTGAAQHARQRLLDDGDLIRGPGGYQVTDPLLADWVRTRFTM